MRRHPAAAVAVRVRPRVGATPDVRRRLAAQRPRPLLVRGYAALFAEGGAVGPAARRRFFRFALRSVPAAVAAGFGALLVLQIFAISLGWRQAGAVAVLLATLSAVTWRGAAHATSGRAATLREQLELGSLYVVAAYTVVQTAGGAAGGLEGPLYPVVYLVMAFLVSFLPRAVGLSLVALAIGLDVAIWRARGGSPDELAATAAHAGFTALFAVLYHAVLAARLFAARHAERHAIENRLREIEERAREYRLLAPAGAAEEAGEARWTEAAVVEVEAAVRGTLEVAEVGLATHTCALFILSHDDAHLLLRECRSRSDAVTRRPISAAEGLLALAVKRREPVRLAGEVKAASYYDDGTRPRAFLAVPLVDRRGGQLRGVLVADRIEAAPFSEDDERLLVALSAELFRAIAAERLMNDMKRTRDEKERFYDAIRRLNRTTTPRQVFDATLAAANDLVRSVGFAAVTVVEESGERKPVHRVVRVIADEQAQAGVALEGHAFKDGTGLVSSATKLGSSLPGTDLDPDKAVLFDEGTRVKGLESVKVVPLKAGDDVLGTLVLGSRRRGAFDSDTVHQLEVVAMQAADSILRARLFEQTERLATTDGLTGLLNHRTFQSRLDEHLAQAARYGKKLSLILCDIDHFKSVNDTYGHPVGDVVLKGVARALAKEARTTDVVARYGGEEFAVVMPETDAEGAIVIAERIREKVRSLVFETELGPLKVTMSLGIATCPVDASKKAALVEAADGCLYHAKRNGRNRSVARSRMGAPAAPR